MILFDRIFGTISYWNSGQTIRNAQHNNAQPRSREIAVVRMQWTNLHESRTLSLQKLDGWFVRRAASGDTLFVLGDAGGDEQAVVLIGFPFISYLNTRKKGHFLHFLLKIAEKEGKDRPRSAGRLRSTRRDTRLSLNYNNTKIKLKLS